MSNNGESDEDIDPATRRKLTIPLMTELCDEDLEPSLTEDQLEIAKTPEMKTLLFYFSRFEKKLDHNTKWIMIINRHQRLNEARRIEQDSLRWKSARWVTVTVVAAFLAALGKKALDVIPWP